MTVSEFDCLATKYDRKNGHCTWRHKQKKIGSLYYMVVSANAGILQWEYVSMCMCMCIDMYNKCMSMRMCTRNGLTNRNS